ncbi:MAG: lasso peptide biosynthesis B2 protein [Nitrospirae bacterium]|nr:lasso peptide biosynthesis B2 protein [Nitrospirota bacterium]
MANPSTHLLAPPRALGKGVSQSWFMVRLGVWLCWLSILLRIHTLPALLKQITPLQGEPRSPLETERAVQLVVRLCRLPFFRRPVFPRLCLRQSLALYRTLTRMGYPVEIHFGIQKDGEDLRGHSWVTVHGQSVAENAQREVFTAIYSYSSATNRSLAD